MWGCGLLGTIYAMSVLNPPRELTTQRRWVRHHFDVPVRLICGKGKRPKTVDARGTELNEGGLGVYVGVELAVGERVDIELAVPFYRSICRIRGVVRNRPGDGYYYGIEFLDLTPADKGEIVLLGKMLESAAGHLDG